MFEDLVKALLYSWQNADAEQVEAWASGEAWAELQALAQCQAAKQSVQADEFICLACNKSLATYWSFCPQCGQAQVTRR